MKYSVFGITIDSDYSPLSCLLPVTDSPDLTFSIAEASPVEFRWHHRLPLYESPFESSDGLPTMRLYRYLEWDILRFSRRAMDVYLSGGQIICHPIDSPVDKNVLERRLLGVWLAYWLEKRGIPMLHASAVVVDGQGVAFVSDSGQGKSTLAMTMMQSGYPLLSDDIVPVERLNDRFWGRSGYPQMRLWPEEAERFVGQIDGLRPVGPNIPKLRVPIGEQGFGSFCQTAQPLTRLYIPKKFDPGTKGRSEVIIEDIAPQEALIELVRYSFIPRFMEAAGLQPERMALFARLVEQVPVKRLRYPAGYDHLASVRQSVLADLAG